MGSPIEIIRLRPEQKRTAAKVISAAFFDYQEMRSYFPDPIRRAKILPWYLGNVITCAMHYGDALTTPELSGVILTLPPGHTRLTEWEYVKMGFFLAPWVIGFRDFKRSQESESFLAALHAQVLRGRPHIYLWALGVDPARKGQGIGSALIKPVLEKADAGRFPVYLETHDPLNVAYYQSKGFHLMLEEIIPTYQIPVWSMLREPTPVPGFPSDKS